MISIEHMTPIKRYAVLNEAIKESRKEEFYIHIKGVDELNILSDSVMLEGCNTSFQMHLQINPDNFIDSYNWAQAISGPILSICTNSPLLFGKELWSETRIALFTQSVDTRTNSFLLNEKQSRVSFGNNWETGSVADIFKDNVSRFRSLVTSTFEKDSVAMVENGEVPKLTALNLHNGTVYRWNRVCYGVGNNKPHLRIENRYIPSGPTTTDEIANMVFWVGVMSGRPKQYENIHEKMDFKDIKANFFNAARYGMYAQFSWNDKIVSAKSLLQDELLPMAYEGLSKLGVSKVDATYYLKIIEDRLISNDGSRWISKSYRNLLKLKKPFEAAQILTSHLYENQDNGSTIDSWEILHKDTKPKYSSKKVVKHLMNTDIFSVDEEDSIELVLNIMQWKNIHHLPVIDHEKKIIGLLLWKDIEKFIHNQEKLKDNVKTIMRTGIITTSQYTTIDKAKEKMQHYKIDCLPVVEQNRLIGIITLKDF